MGHRTVVFLLWAALLMAPRIAGAGAWLQPQGKLWLKLGTGWVVADSRFANNRRDLALDHPDGRPVQPGDEIPFDFITGGEYQVFTVALEAHYGVTNAVELSLRLPFHETEFSNLNQEVEPGTGIGDIRLATALRLLHPGRFVMSTRLDVKLPTGAFPRSIYQQPLGEGQLDLTLWLRGGLSLWPTGWANAELGYRWRFENQEAGFDPGNERLLQAEIGFHTASWLDLKLELRGLWGDQWIDTGFGVNQELGRRSLISLDPSLLVILTERWALELAVAVVLAGEDLPVADGFRVAVMGTPW